MDPTGPAASIALIVEFSSPILHLHESYSNLIQSEFSKAASFSLTQIFVLIDHRWIGQAPIL